MPSKDQIIKEIKALESEFNNKLKELSGKLPDYQVRVSSFWHPKHPAEESFITIWGFKRGSKEVF